MKIKIISVDFQKEFTDKKGKWFNPGDSIGFIKKILIPFLLKKNIKIFEIVSDYRQPRIGDRGDGCCPGSFGFVSEICDEVKNKDVWIKCMNSPIWVRENIGKINKTPGIPYQDPKRFTKWLDKNIGNSKKIDFIVLIGLTADCCVLSVAQELSWRGYEVKILKEATDTVRGDKIYKKQILTESPLLNWAEVINWSKLKKYLE